MIMWSLDDVNYYELNEPLNLEITQKVYLKAVANGGYLFSYWDGEIFGNDTIYFYEELESITVNAVFMPEGDGEGDDYYVITPGTHVGGTIMWSLDDTVYYELNEPLNLEITQKVYLKAVANCGYLFSYWDGEIFGNDTIYFYEELESITVNAVFIPEGDGEGDDYYVITPGTHTGGMIMWSLDDVNYYELNEPLNLEITQTVYLKAVANGGYLFSYWDGDIFGNDTVYFYEELESITVNAVFIAEGGGEDDDYYVITPGTHVGG
jgi:hypothetical protein